MTTDPSSAAFVALWSAHGPRIYSYIYTLVANRADADDAFQETSVVLLEKFGEFEPGSNFFAWACRVAHFKALKSVERRRPSEPLNESLLAAIGETQQSLLDNADARVDALAACVESLTRRDRKLINLRYTLGADIKAIAARMDRSAPVIYRSLARIHESLLLCIRRRLAEGEDA